METLPWLTYMHCVYDKIHLLEAEEHYSATVKVFQEHLLLMQNITSAEKCDIYVAYMPKWLFGKGILRHFVTMESISWSEQWEKLIRDLYYSGTDTFEVRVHSTIPAILTVNMDPDVIEMRVGKKHRSRFFKIVDEA